jgi:hypothetical protein
MDFTNTKRPFPSPETYLTCGYERKDFMSLQRHRLLDRRTMLCTVLFLSLAASVFAANTDPSIRSFHWQPSEGYTLGGTYTGDHWKNFYPPAADVPALTSAGSYSPLILQIISVTAANDFLQQTTDALWLDTAADGKRYVCDFTKPIIVSIGAEDAHSDNHTIFFIAKNSQVIFSTKLIKWGNRFHISLEQTSLESDTLTLTAETDSAASKFVTKYFPVSLKPVIRSGRWVPYYVRLESVSGITPTIMVRFGIANKEIFNTTCNGKAIPNANIADDRAWFYETDAGYHTTAQVSDVHLFCTSDTVNTAAVLWKKFFSDSSVQGPVEHVPMVIHNIIYDPPGKQSYETCLFDTSLVTKFDYNFSVKGGVSLEVGSKSSVGVGDGVSWNTSWTATAKGETHFAYNSDSSTEISLSTSTATSSMTNENNNLMIGPAFGDVVVYQKYVYGTIMTMRPKMNRFRTATKPQDYVWAIGVIPLVDSCSTVYYTPVRTLVSDLKNDNVDLAFLQQEYPYDLNTGKLKPSVFLPGRNQKGDSVGARITPFEGTYSIGGSLWHEGSTTREQLINKDTSGSVGASLTLDGAIWTPGIGAEVILSGGCDFAETMGASTSKGSTVFYHLEDDNPWNIFKVTPYVDKRFSTILFDLDSANSYSSFPYENNTRKAVSWLTASMPACTGYVGQATVVSVKVTNTSPKATLTNLPDAFPFSVSAINFPGTFTVYPEDVWISVGQQQEFTCTFTGASAGTFTQQIRVICHHNDPNNSSTMEEMVSFPMVLKNANVGLVVYADKDTAAVIRGSTPFNTFHVTLTNTGVQAANVIIGADSASVGTTVNYGAISNPIAAGDSTTLAVSLTGDGNHDYYIASFWAQIENEPTTKSHHTLVIAMRDPVGISAHRGAEIIRELGMKNIGGGRLELLVPRNETPSLRLFSVTGALLLSQRPAPGVTVCDLNALHLSNGYYILRMQGAKKTVQQKILISGKR